MFVGDWGDFEMSDVRCQIFRCQILDFEMSDVRKIREKSLRLQTYKIRLLHRETGRKKRYENGGLQSSRM